MPSFAEQLTQYMKRVGITDAELARKIGVQRQTIFRWKEGAVGRPRVREDVLKCAECLRLTPDERDQLLLAAGFAPEQPIFATPPAAPPVVEPPASPTVDESPRPPAATRGLILTPSEPVASELIEAEPSRPAPGPTETLSRPPVQPQTGRFPPPWWLSLALFAVLLLVLIGGFRLYRGLSQPQPGSLTSLMASATPAPSIAPAAIPASSLSLPKAPGGIVVSQFSTVLDSARYDVAKRIKEAVDAELSQTELTRTTVLIWPQNILTKESAEEVLQTAQAALVIWGEYDSGRVVVQFTMHNKPSDQREIPVANPNELNSTINVKMKEAVKVLALLTLGKAYLNDGSYAKAQLAFTRAVALKPEEHDTQTTLYFNLGYLTQNLAYQNRSQPEYEQAIGYYSKTIDLNPTMVEALYNRGAAYLEKSYLMAANSDEITKSLNIAIDDLTKAIKMGPKYKSAYINRGISYYERHQAADLQAAIDDFDQVIKLDPRDYKGYYNRGLTRIRAGGLAGWTTDLTQTLAITPSYSPAFDVLCWGYVLAQQPTLALPYCDQSIALEEKLGPTRSGRVSRGIAYTEVGRYADALADFKIHQAWLKSLQPTTLYERLNGRKVEQWLAAVQQQKNPFDAATLAALR